MLHASLRTRLTLMVMLAIVPALLLALSSGLQQRLILISHASDVSVRLAKDVADDEGLLIDDTRRLLATLATNPVVLGDDSAACGALLASLLAADGTYSNLAVLAPNGDTACSAQGLSGPTNGGDRQYFQRALATRQFAVGEYVIGRLSGQPALLTGYPVLDASGAVRAVIHAGINLSWVSKVAEEFKLPAGSHVTVVTPDGLVLERHPDGTPWRGQSMTLDGSLAAQLQAGARHGV